VLGIGASSNVHASLTPPPPHTHTHHSPHPTPLHPAHPQDGDTQWRRADGYDQLWAEATAEARAAKARDQLAAGHPGGAGLLQRIRSSLQGQGGEADTATAAAAADAGGGGGGQQQAAAAAAAAAQRPWWRSWLGGAGGGGAVHPHAS